MMQVIALVVKVVLLEATKKVNLIYHYYYDKCGNKTRVNTKGSHIVRRGVCEISNVSVVSTTHMMSSSSIRWLR